MHNKNMLIVQTFLLLLWQPSYTANFITTGRFGGRFGDQLLLYAKAKAFSYIFKIPYSYRPFLHSHQLRLHGIEKKYPAKYARPKTIEIRHQEKLRHALIQHAKTNTLYAVDYRAHVNPFLLPEEFRLTMRKLIHPQRCIKPLKLFTEEISVAIHVRRGDCYPHRGGYGLKCHEDEEYIELLKHLLDQLKNTKIYVHIFTDDSQPQIIAQKFETSIKKRNVNPMSTVRIKASYLNENATIKRNARFGHETGKNNQNPHSIVRDFCNMASADYLIRPYGSNFSIMAQFAGNHKMVLAVKDPHPETPEYIEKTYCRDNKATAKNKEQINFVLQ